MEAQSRSATAPTEQPEFRGPRESGSAPAETSAQTPSRAPSQVLSPINPQPNPATHYANGLPRSINGLQRHAANGSSSPGPSSPALATGMGTPGTTAPSGLNAPSPVMMTTPTIAASAPPPARPLPPASAPVLAPAPLKPMKIYTPSQPPKSALPRQPPQRQSSLANISILEPPGTTPPRPQAGQQSPQGSGFPSPRKAHHRENPKFVDDLSRLTHAMQQSLPAAARRVVRDNWEKCLLGSEFHHAFILNAVIHHSSGTIIRRSIKDFGAKMVPEAKREIFDHLSTSDLDEITDSILEKASDKLLDKALEKRLATIDARSLIDYLARAERLGYEDSGVVDERRGFNPAPAPLPFDPTPQPPPVPMEPVPRPMPREPVHILQCPLCWRKFDREPAYIYHVQKQVCTKEPPNNEGFAFSCQYCGSGFITKVGRDYHIINNVCGDHGTAGPTPQAPTNGASPITVSSGNNSPVVQPPSSTVLRSSENLPASTPVARRVSTAPTPASKDHNPYAHLNPSTLEKLNEELRQAELHYTARFKETEMIEDPAARQAKRDGYQNSFSTKQSIIRKKYGVRLRNRRTRAEIDSERQRMGWPPSSPGQSEGPPSAKRQRTDDGSSHTGLQIPKTNDAAPRMNTVSVSDMKTGLGGSNSTAATADPTLQHPPAPPQPTTSQQQQQQQPSAAAPNSLSSLQRQGYRVSSHLPQPSQTSSQPAQVPTPTKDVVSSVENSSTPKQGGTASEPMVLDDAESSDSGSDEDIPASLPPRKVEPVQSTHLGP
ncbi:hypothetical protein GGR52DRAFT_540770 [Hypoxylon sp. FL1284]|nr:hypothetical protein GGR52DRAFT_540770 [Hypoxylon sp. FL1284]